MDQPLLSDLCAICLTEKPIYRCPRCRSRTCSLKCYKRHQQRASCSGKRDPTSYVKKAQWATPTGIDQDYNYLKGVERGIEEASQDVVQRGIGVETRQKSKVATRGWQAGSEFQKYLIDNRITIHQAPKGMSRERTNHSRTTKGGSVFWTIEWIDDAGIRDVQHDCLGTKSVAELDDMRWTQKRNIEKRRLEVERREASQQRSKRKRLYNGKDQESIKTDPASQKEHVSKPAADEHAISASEVHNTDESKVASVSRAQNEDASQNSDAVDQHHAGMPDAASPPVDIVVPESETIKGPSTHSSDPAPDPPDQTPSTAATPPSQSYYYLLRPATTGVTRVLIPLDSHISFTECLRDQVLQEYPTVYVLPHAPDHLPDGFLLSDKYDSSAGSKISEIASDRPGNKGRTKDEPSGGDARKTAAELDPHSILEMLKRDISL